MYIYIFKALHPGVRIRLYYKIGGKIPGGVPGGPLNPALQILFLAL